MTDSNRTLYLRVGEGLGFRFERLSVSLERYLRRFLVGSTCGPSASAPDDLVIIEGLPPPDGNVRHVVLSEGPVQIWRAGAVVGLESLGATGWCDPGRGVGGLIVRSSEPHTVEAVAALMAAPLLMELAAARGWLGLHAAGVAWEGRGVLLPAPSGGGKSTIFRNAAAAGLDVLSDDLIWLEETPEGFRMWPFPRGAPAEAAPDPTAADVPVAAIVCPTITDGEHSRLVALRPEQAFEALVTQGGFLAGGRHTAARFASLVRLASTPAWRLEAGSAQQEVPDLLRAAASTNGSSAKAR